MEEKVENIDSQKKSPLNIDSSNEYDIIQQGNLLKKTDDELKFEKSKESICLYYCLSILFLIISIIFYYLSLRICKENKRNECSNIFINDGIFIIISSLFYSFIFEFIIIEYINIIFGYISIIIYSIIIYMNKGLTSKEHGTYNGIAFIFLTIIFVIIFQRIYILIEKVKKIKKYKILIAIFLSFILYLLISYILIDIFKLNLKNIFNYLYNVPIIEKDPEKECEKWGYGLGGKRIENKEESKKNNNACYIKYPKTCYKFMYYGKLDKSKEIGLSCEKENINSKARLLKYKGKEFENTKTFAYPITQNLNDFNDITFDEFKFPKNMINKIYDINNPPKDSLKPEVTVTFDDKGRGTVKMEIIRNEELIKKKKLLFEKSKPKYDNVYMIYIDSFGREQFFKTCPKTRKILEEYYWDNKNKKPKVSSFQFLKYLNFAGWTDMNVTPMMFGKYYMQSGTHISKFYNDNGYITANVGEFFTKTIYPIYRWNKNTIRGFYFDHELISLFCDPNVNDPNDCFSEKNKSFGYYSNYRNCLYGKDAIEYAFEYGLKFLEAYKDVPKYLRIWSNDAHESTQEVVKYIDDSLSNFLQILIDKYMISRSMVFLISDHHRGMYDIGQDFIADDGEIERTIGLLFMIMNDFNKDNNNYFNRNAMIKNEQKFVVPYDVFMTMVDGLNINDNDVRTNKGQSLDIEIDGMKRTCHTWKEYTHKGKKIEEDCRCLDF